MSGACTGCEAARGVLRADFHELRPMFQLK
jgi:hypothetical protein